MPTSSKPGDGWVLMDQQAVPMQELVESEVKSYLTWLFGDIAKKPKPMSLRETASVVRYMRWLGTQGIPSKVISKGPRAIKKYSRGISSDDMRKREHIERMARMIWGDLLNLGHFEASTKRQAQSFFKKHAGEWHHPSLALALEFLDQFEIPPGVQQPYGPATLVSQHIGAQGKHNPFLEDDLSERIAAADYALKRKGIKARRRLIADALDQSKVTVRKEFWEPDDVRNRVRTYERQKDATRPQALANKWIVSYRSATRVIDNQVSTKPGSTVG